MAVEGKIQSLDSLLIPSPPAINPKEGLNPAYSSYETVSAHGHHLIESESQNKVSILDHAGFESKDFGDQGGASVPHRKLKLEDDSAEITLGAIVVNENVAGHPTAQGT